MANDKYKPCSFYIPVKDTDLVKFVSSQSNISLSMRLLMKAFIASNRGATDIDVSYMDLSDLIRSMRADPELFNDVPRKIRPMRSISAIEADEARQQVLLQAQAQLPPQPDQGASGFVQAASELAEPAYPAAGGMSGHAAPPPAAPPAAQDPGAAYAYADPRAARDPGNAPVPAGPYEMHAPAPKPEPEPASAAPGAAYQSAGVPQPRPGQAAGPGTFPGLAGEEDPDIMSMMGGS